MVKRVFMLFFSVLFINNVKSESYKIPVITEQEVRSILNSVEKPNVQCYCSYKCGPRDVKPDDTPFYDEELGICFCKKRDQDAYSKPGHECHLKNNVDFPNSCGRKQFFRRPKNVPAILPVSELLK